MDDLGFRTQKAKNIFLFSKASILALEPNQMGLFHWGTVSCEADD
jgi:hypothetical protein